LELPEFPEEGKLIQSTMFKGFCNVRVYKEKWDNYFFEIYVRRMIRFVNRRL